MPDESTALVVEDDENLGHSLRRFLIEEGHECDWVQSIEKAKAVLMGNSVDLLILDLVLIVTRQ